MRWPFQIVAMLVSMLAGPFSSCAGEVAKARSIDDLKVAAEIPRSADFMAWGFDALWMMTGETAVLVDGELKSMGPSLVRIDGTSNSADDIKIPQASASVRGLAIGEEAVWIPDARNEQILKFDPREKRVTLTISVPFSGTEGSIGVGEGAVWITARGNVLTRFNASTGAEEGKIELPGGAPAAIVDNGIVWVTGFAGNELYKVDAKSLKLVKTIPLHSSPRFLTAGEGSIWVLNQGDGTIQRIEPMSGEVIATIETGHPGSGGDIATGGGYVWVTLRDVPLVQIDPKTNTVVALFNGTGWGDAIRFGGGSVWISGHSIHRLTPP